MHSKHHFKISFLNDLGISSCKFRMVTIRSTNSSQIELIVLKCKSGACCNGFSSVSCIFSHSGPDLNIKTVFTKLTDKSRLTLKMVQPASVFGDPTDIFQQSLDRLSQAAPPHSEKRCWRVRVGITTLRRLQTDRADAPLDRRRRRTFGKTWRYLPN